MRQANCRNLHNLIHKQLAEIRISEDDRRRAVYALLDAEAIANAVIWFKDRIASLGGTVLKPFLRRTMS